MTATALVLDFEKHRLHALQRGGLIWFVLADVCESLEIEVRDAAKRLEEDDKGVDIIHTLGGLQRMRIVSEYGVYDLATTSRKANAKRFKRWLFREVLPELRRTGSYQGGSAPLDALIGSLQPELDLSPANDAIGETQRGSGGLVKRHEAPELTPHPSEWSPSYAKWRERTIEATLPRPRNFLDAISETGHTPQGYGDSTTEKPTMFMRDQLPIGHSADSWRVWVSEQWFRLPLDLRRRWWRDTNYGECAPSDGMIQAIIAIALP